MDSGSNPAAPLLSPFKSWCVRVTADRRVVSQTGTLVCTVAFKLQFHETAARNARAAELA